MFMKLKRILREKNELKRRHACMVKQKPWDIREAVILLDAVIRVYEGKVDRKTAIAEVSTKLRLMAVKNGLQIDEIYRNIAGITFQMYSMESAYLGYTVRKPATKLFTETVTLRKENKKEYDKILQEVYALMDADKSLEEKFIAWLSEKVSPAQLSELYMVVSSINEFCISRKILKQPLLITDDLSILSKVRSTIESNRIFRFKYKRQVNKMSVLIRQYITFIKEQLERANNTPVAENEREVFDNRAELANEDALKPQRIRGNQNPEKRAEYQEWLIASGMANTAARNYGNWLNRIDEYAIENDISAGSVYDMDEVQEIVSLYDELCNDAELMQKHRDYFVSLRKYIAYRSDGQVVLGRTRTSSGYQGDASGEKRAAYQEWLVLNGLVSTAARNYGNWLNKIDQYAIDNGYSSESVHEIESIEELQNLFEILNNDEELARSHRDYLTSMKKYIAYREDEEFVPSDYQGQVRVNSASINEEDERLKQEYPEIYMRLRSMSKVYDDVQGLSVSRIMEMLGVPIDVEELEGILHKVSWITRVGEDVYSFSKYAKAYEKPIEFDKESFIRVLLMRYQNGMRFDSIDLENFRETYSDVIDEVLTLTDEELVKCLKKCGVLYKDRIFPAAGIVNEAAKLKLLEYIVNSFDAGKKVLYYKAIYSDLSDVFEYCFNLTDPMMLKPYLQYVCDDETFYFYDEYITKEKNVRVDHTSEIEEYLLSMGKPLSYEEMYAGLSHVSNEVIYSVIKTSSNIILNEREHYFHYGIFEFSSEDADQISGYISGEIEEEGYCIWSRIYEAIKNDMPLFIENNVYLSSVGIRNAVAKKLSGRFNFDGEVICNRGQSLNMADVYRLYGSHHAPFSDDDIYEFCKEVSGGVIYFDALSETTVRVSRELFIARNQIQFDVEATDKAISTYFTTGYMPVKDIDSYLVFPNVGHEWNTFLLESYLMYFSKSYALRNNGKSLNNVAGVVVKKGSGFDDFVDVCADVLANSGVDLTKDKALDYLANQNMLTRRSYKDIEKAIVKAKQIRNKKG